MNTELSKTPLFHCHLQLGARMVPFAGFEMPVQYCGVLEEARTVRTHCGIFDVSHMGQIIVRGKKAVQEVNKLVTNNLETIVSGQAQYNILCNESGGCIDDLIIYKRSDSELFICINAANRKADVEWFKSQLTGNVGFEDVSDETALLAVQGPKAEEILAPLGNLQLIKNLKYFQALDTTLLDCPCFLSRTGYTGEDGFEIYLSTTYANLVWNGILERGRRLGLIPIGLGARDTLRLEMGYALHGHEISPTISPLSAGLSWAVKVDKSSHFVGQEALKKEMTEGSAKRLKAFTLSDRRIPRPQYRILSRAGNPVGSITSGTFSPNLNHSIAMGFVDKTVSEEKEYLIEIRGEHIPTSAVKLPFVPAKTKSSREM